MGGREPQRESLMPRWLKHVFYVVCLVVFAGCAGSCSSCSGCGMTPLDGGFPNEKRIENAASVRLTESGLKFIGDNLGAIAPNLLGDVAQGNAGVVTFDVPPVNEKIKDPIFGITLGTAKVCTSGSKPTANPPECLVEADLGKAKLTIATKAPHNITIDGSVAVRLQRAPLEFGIIKSDIVLTNGAKCSPRDYADIPVSVDVSIEVDDDVNHGSRTGYSRVKIAKLTIDDKKIENSIGFCGGGLSATVLNLVKGLVVGNVIGGLTDTLKETVEEQLCTSQDPSAGITCPSGSIPDSDDVCRYCNPDANGICQDKNTECVSLALGIDGNFNLSQALSSLSPGTKGGFDFMMAVGGEGLRDDSSGFSWGDLNPTPSAPGATLGLMGGAEPKPVTQCVPIAALTQPTGIPIPDELTANTLAGWTGEGPHLGLALSERYMNYALGAVYNSGALCLGIGSSTLGSLLSSDTVGLLIPSLKDLARQRKAAPLALVLRPQQPPVATVGNGTDIKTDPLLGIALDKLSIDFYVWSNDRYIRGFTATFDVVAPVNLDVTSEGLAPVIDEVQINNPEITNGPLLREDTASAAKALAGIVGSQIGGALGGAIDPINLNDQLSSVGLTLDIPPTVQGQGSPGLRKLEKGTDRFLGIFAALGVAPPATNSVPEFQLETLAEVREKRVTRDGLTLPTLTEQNHPVVVVRASSPQDNGAQRVEYQYRVNGGIWHPWTFKKDLEIRTPDLLLQANHYVEVRSRVEGKPHSMDSSPVRLDFRIDKTAPFVDLGRRPKAGKVDVFVRDTVSARDKVRVRYAVDDEAFGEWGPADQLSSIEVGAAAQVRIEAVDEEGNVASVSQRLIRGKEDASLGGDSGCNCSLVGTNAGGSSPLRYGFPALLALGLGLFARRRARRRPRPERKNPAALRRARTLSGVAMMAVAMSYSGCSCGDDGDSKSNGGTGGKPAGSCPDAEDCELLEPGLIGAYASATVAADGTVWISAYNDFGYGVADSYEETYEYGDLVVGKLEGDKVEWASVDGLPSVDESLEPGAVGGPPDPFLFDITGFRNGLTEPGDDVGLWTSIAVIEDQPAVAYYDATNRALRYARFDGKAWSSHEVQAVDKADIGRYAKLLNVDGKPVIAFLAIEAGGTDGMAKSTVRVATASSGSPGAAADWTFEDAAVDALTPCNAALCGGDSCVTKTGKCSAKIGGCDPKCGTGEACVDIGAGAACEGIDDPAAPSTYPEAAGLYIALAKTGSGLGIAYYDRIHGNLMAVRKDGGTWQPPVLVDGQTTGPNGPVDSGDVGLGAGLFVDTAGDWHLSYVNGFDETLIYMKLAGGTTPGAPEVVDDGSTADGQAVVGDDSSIFVTSSGEVRIAYQDATNGTLRWAVGTPSGATHTWAKKTLTVPGFSGGFNQILDVGGASKVVSFWREAKPKTRGDVAVISP